MQFKSAALAALCATGALGLQLTVNKNGGNASSPFLYGIMIEDINHSVDGSISNQRLRNNGFQGENAGLTAYSAVGGAAIAQDSQNPLSDAIPSTLSIKPNGASGTVGVANEGYFGIRIETTDTYRTSFWVKGDYTGPLHVAIVGDSSGTEFGATDVSVTSNANSFTYVESTFTVQQSTSESNHWQLTFDAASIPNGLNIALPSLWSPGYNGRANGVDKVIGDTMAALKPSFLRFPGGNNLEGQTVDTRWKWNETIGPLENRPGRQGDWGYPNTDSFGLIEYVHWCQDFNMEPLLGVWAGLSLDGTQVTGSALQPYIDDVMNELEYLMGDSSTTYGALRISHGETDPITIRYVEIGNEDFLHGDSYQERFDAFRSAIKAKYPDITCISTVAPQNGAPITVGEGDWLDVHDYSPPKSYVEKFSQFDNWNRSQPLIVGEFGSTTDDNGNTNYFSSMKSAAAEAIYTFGLERNSDIIKLALYAPLHERFEDAQWHPNLFGYQTSNGVTRSVSYFAQQLLYTSHGHTTLPVEADGAYGPVYWVASGADSATYVKLVNYGDNESPVTITIDGASTGTLSLISGPPDTTNNQVENLKPSSSSVTASGGSFEITLPAWSVAVLAADL